MNYKNYDIIIDHTTLNFKYNLNYHLLKENFLVATKRMMCSACSSDQPRKSPTKPPVSAT